MLNELAADQITVILVPSALELACYSTVPRCEIEDRTKWKTEGNLLLLLCFVSSYAVTIEQCTHSYY